MGLFSKKKSKDQSSVPSSSASPASSSSSSVASSAYAASAGPSSAVGPPPAEPTENPKRTPTDSSYYSCSNLQPDDEWRYLKAADVRRQVEEIPEKKPRIFRPNATSPKPRLAGYPDQFLNREKIETLTVKKPWQEYPVLPDGQSWDPCTIAKEGKARAIFCKHDRSKFDVVYHDKTVSSHNGKNFTMANYRPAVAGVKAKA